MSRSFVLDDAVVLAGHLLLQNYYNGGFTLHPDVSERLNKLLRPFADKDGRLTPVLGLKERIAELEKEINDG